jgi:phage-related minor tail protein
MSDDNYIVRIEADSAPFANALDDLSRLSDRFGRQFTSAMSSAALSGKSLEDVLRRVGLNLAGLALQQGMRPLQTLASSLFSSALGGLSGVVPFAKGGVPGQVTPFAAGGVVSSPTYFPMGGNRMGLMGEAGAEAIMPLRRGADGTLGVAAGGSQTPVNITFNIETRDAASFRKSEAQIATMLARAVSRSARHS